MTIDEAIKKIQYVIDDYPEIYSGEVLAALKLGIEAPKLITQEPPCGYTCIPRPLPGETKS